jgi:hypothetical protein
VVRFVSLPKLRAYVNLRRYYKSRRFTTGFEPRSQRSLSRS